MKFKRILLKLSGEALMGKKKYGIDPLRLEQYSQEIKKVKDLGLEIAIVIGGGNIFRGESAEAIGIDRVQGDYMGMLATVINGMALQSALEKAGMFTRLMSGIKVEQVCEQFIRRRAIRHLEKGRIVIVAGFQGLSGNAEITTLGRGGSDTTAVALAAALDARADLACNELGVVLLQGVNIGNLRIRSKIRPNLQGLLIFQNSLIKFPHSKIDFCYGIDRIGLSGQE